MTEATEVVIDAIVEEPASGRPDALPYVAYSRFRSLIGKVRSDGLPQVFDQSFFGAQSGSLTAQQRGALKFLDLIDDERRPTGQLRKLVQANDDDEFRALLRTIAQEKYASAIELGMDATRGQLAELFRSRGLTGETVNKAIAFFLGMTEEAAIPVSPHFRRGAAATGTTARRAPRRRKVEAKAAAAPAPTIKPALSDPGAQKAAYIQMLMDMAQKSGEGELQKDLLNRIEKALGLAAEPAPTPIGVAASSD